MVSLKVGCSQKCSTFNMLHSASCLSWSELVFNEFKLKLNEGLRITLLRQTKHLAHEISSLSWASLFPFLLKMKQVSFKETSTGFSRYNKPVIFYIATRWSECNSSARKFKLPADRQSLPPAFVFFQLTQLC